MRNAFRWKDSVGAWEERPGHFGDVWGYWTDDGFGYFEGLQVPSFLYFSFFFFFSFLIREILSFSFLSPPSSVL